MASAARKLTLLPALITLAVLFALYVVTRPPAILFPHDELRIGIDPSYPPFGVDTGQGLAGIDVDLGRAIGERIGAPNVRFVLVGFDGLYDSVRADQVDILISALSPDRAREQIVRYTRPYFDAGLMLVGADAPASMDALPGNRVAYEFGGAGDALLRRYARLTGDFEAQPYEQSTYALDAARLGLADAALVDAVSARLYLRDHADWHAALHPVAPQPYVIAVRREHISLYWAVDDALAALIADGTLAAILARWL